MVFKFFRKRRNFKIIMWATAILIIPGFLIWGIGVTGGGREKNLAAVVNRSPITLRDYYAQVGEVEKRYRSMFGENYDRFAANLNIEQSVIEEMIRERILIQQASRRRIRVSDSDVVEAVRSDPAFKDEKGNFSQDLFSRIIGNMPPGELKKIEAGVRKQLLMNKLRQQVTAEGKISVTDAEVDEYVAKNKFAATMDKEQIRKMLQSQKESRYFGEWYEKTRKAARVVVYVATAKPAEPPAPPAVPAERTAAETPPAR